MNRTENITARVVPVRKYKPPKYPTQVEANLNPDLLRKLPPQWQKNATVIIAAGLLGTMALTSCHLHELPSYADYPYDPPRPGYLNVAPIFIHGDGTGAIGCVMMTPPVFLSEAEAFAVIKSVSERYGLTFDAASPGYIATDNEVLYELPLSEWCEENNVIGYALGNGNVPLGLYDDEKGVAIAFVAMRQAAHRYVLEDDTWINDDGEEMIIFPPETTITHFRPRELAELSAADFSQQQGDATIGIFYDSGLTSEQWHKLYDAYRRNGYSQRAARQIMKQERAIIEENLRAQVRDFLGWLRGQGII